MNHRLGGLAGFAFIVLTLSTLFLAPAPPDPSGPASEMAGYVREHDTGVGLQAIVFGLAALTLVAFVGAAVDRVGGPAPSGSVAGTAWVGVTLLSGGWGLSYAIGAGLGVYGDRLADDSIVAGMVMYGAAASVGGIGSVLLLGAFAGMARRTASLPRWLVNLAAIGAVVHLGTFATYVTDDDAVFSLMYLGFGLLAVWIVGVSLVLVRGSVDGGAAVTAARA